MKRTLPALSPEDVSKLKKFCARKLTDWTELRNANLVALLLSGIQLQSIISLRKVNVIEDSVIALNPDGVLVEYPLHPDFKDFVLQTTKSRREYLIESAHAAQPIDRRHAWRMLLLVSKYSEVSFNAVTLHKTATVRLLNSYLKGEISPEKLRGLIGSSKYRTLVGSNIMTQEGYKYINSL